MMRVARRLFHVLIIVLTLIVGATAAAIIVTQTAWFKEWLRGYIVAQANQYLNGELSIARLGGNLFFGLELQDVGVSLDGTEIVAVKDLGLDYNVFEMISRGLSVNDIRLNQPVLYLRRDGDAWSITKLIKRQEQEADREGPAAPITIDAIGISDASIVIDDPVGTSGVNVPARVDRIDAEMSFKYEPVHYSLEISHLSFRASEPAIGLNALSGGVAVRDDTVFVDKLAFRTEESTLSVDGAIQNYLAKPIFNLHVSSDKLSIPELARVLPALAGVQLQPKFEIKTAGSLDQLGVEMNVQSSAGDAWGKFVVDVVTPRQSVAGDMAVKSLNLAPLLKDPSQKTNLTANARVALQADAFSDLSSLTGTVSLTAPRVVAAGYAAENIKADARINGRRIGLNGRLAAYRANLTTQGTVTLAGAGDPLSYDLKGDVRGIDLRQLPSNLKLPRAATAVSAGYHVRGAETTQRSVDGDLRFRASEVAGATIADGSTAGFSMRGADISYRADATVSNLDLERMGRELNVPALATDRYTTNLNAHITADGRGTTLRDISLTTAGTLTNSSILGGLIPSLTFSAEVAADAADVKANGTFSGFDPAVLSGRAALKGTIDGAIDTDARITGVSSGVTADSVAGAVRLTLGPSVVGGVAIERANLDADYRDRSGDIRQLELVGRDINVTATGTVALSDAGQSNLKFHADSPRLAEVGRLFDVPVEGIANVDGIITGNRSELQVSGTLVGNGLTYQENGALALNSKFDVRVPELAFDRASGTAETSATFVTVAGQNINELQAKTTYEARQLTFDVTARQPGRTLAAGGAVTLHTEHQEVHLRSLALDTKGAQWQLDASADPRVNYASSGIAVENVRLVSGDQRITADGSFGRPGDALKISMTQVDLANIDTLLLREPQLGGRLDASATVTGTKESPEVKAEFQVNQGNFRQFKYDGLGGTISYADRRVVTDVRLQQNPAHWITARGSLPMALFTSAEGADRTAPIDFTVDSSPIDLGLVQGFTTMLTDVAGTLEAHVRVTGTADNPQPDGGVSIAGGRMTVAPVGVTYTDIAGQIELDADRVRIEKLTLLDNHQSPLSVTGELAIDARRVQGVQLSVDAKDFKVIDNELGNVRIDSALQISGELKAPRVAGTLSVTTGEVNLDEVVALAGPSAYATEKIEYTAATEAAATPGLFDAVTMDVHVVVPNALVVKADSLQAPGASFSLGALNVTLGGDVQVTKARGGAIRLVGPITTIRGHYDFQGRRFEILRDGSIRFEGLDDLNPRLDIRTRRIIRAVEARVNVRGTLKLPEIELSSTPPLEQADILSLIVFNQPVNELGEGQQVSLAARAQALAAGALAGQLAQSIGNALNLDTFEINVAPETGSAAELTFGQQVGENLYVRVQQGVGEQSTTNVILEYELTDWMRLQTNVVQGSTTQQSLFRRAQSTGADLIVFFSY